MSENIRPELTRKNTALRVVDKLTSPTAFQVLDLLKAISNIGQNARPEEKKQYSHTIAQSLLFSTGQLMLSLALEKFTPNHGNQTIPRGTVSTLLRENPVDLLRTIFTGSTGEEIIYRGMPSVFTKNDKINWKAGILWSTIFALTHNMNITKENQLTVNTKSVPLEQFLSGLFYWYLVRTRGINSSVIAHLTHNYSGVAVQLILDKLFPEKADKNYRNFLLRRYLDDLNNGNTTVKEDHKSKELEISQPAEQGIPLDVIGDRLRFPVAGFESYQPADHLKASCLNLDGNFSEKEYVVIKNEGSKRKIVLTKNHPLYKLTRGFSETRKSLDIFLYVFKEPDLSDLKIIPLSLTNDAIEGELPETEDYNYCFITIGSDAIKILKWEDGNFLAGNKQELRLQVS